ncbi:CinA family protein [Sinomonas humi]|uniref:Damage-inducible protein CinA n=1 Tax=Sinomonas humi TaxID=1338436 RepID=A0A0B2AFX0_9MICC|nr:CinA family protein [Sinomonas humi]KHL00796.1 damage-inducible protein CinA [Sinomonas humi]
MTVRVQDVVAAFIARGTTVATAESLTAGLVAATLADVPGASAMLRGGIVSYASEVKAQLLDVSPDLLREVGSVDGEVARQMAQGTRKACGADYGVSTTGVAGPDPLDGKQVGTVFVAVAGPARTEVRECHFSGSREDIRRAARDAALEALFAALTPETPLGVN